MTVSGCFASLRLDNVPSESRTPSLSMAVEVLPTDHSHDLRDVVATVANDLRATDLFTRVTAGHDPTAQLTVVVRSAGGVGRCGTPLLMSMFTLGLLPGRTAYTHFYDLDLHPRGGPPVKFDRSYTGEELVGLWALPARVSRRWARFPSHRSPSPVIQRLRVDLYELASRLQTHSLNTEDASPNPSLQRTLPGRSPGQRR